ncbi:MAG: hypothetical protein D6763_08040 [Alphaproteobacteria bacterium]|nr:MAG: hypothetical protein D6763_08040 [Alphaproteobacteria bacterium]
MNDNGIGENHPRLATVVINHRFHGPPTSGNGGYTCGLVSQAINGVAEVTLLRPPPLDTPLVLEEDRDRVRLMDNGVEIAIGRPSTLKLDVPPPPPVEEARRAADRYSDFAPFFVPTCFVCGIDRKPGDGLCIHAGPLEGRTRPAVAAPWTIHQNLVGDDGRIRHEFLTAALDFSRLMA